eukprot:Skav236100  [mRNA]  locus=scaffold1166:206471:208880:+ [translate_table: standard]
MTESAKGEDDSGRSHHQCSVGVSGSAAGSASSSSHQNSHWASSKQMNLESKPTWYSCMLTPRTEVPSDPSEQKLPSETWQRVEQETAADLAALQREDLRELGMTMVEAAKVIAWAQADAERTTAAHCNTGFATATWITWSCHATEKL